MCRSIMDIVQLKALAGFLFLLLALFFGWTPFILLFRYSKSESKKPSCLLTQHLHALASGVLLATCLLHLLPESVQAVNDAMASTIRDQEQATSSNASSPEDESVKDCKKVGGDNGDMYPVAELMVALGFLFIYCVDSSLKTWQASGKHEEIEETELDTIISREKDRYVQRHGRFSEQMSDRIELFKKSSQERSVASSENGYASHSTATLDYDNCADEDDSLRKLSKSSMVSRKDFSNSVESHPLAELHQSERLEAARSTAPRVRSLALVAALCIHGFFDGVMLGLQTSERVLFSLFLALSLHKSFVSVSLSLTLLNNYQSRRHGLSSFVAFELLYIFLFASAAPLGLSVSSVFVHTAVDFNLENSASESSDISVLPGCFQAFAVGTFIFVTFSELSEHSNQEEVNFTEGKRKSVVRKLINHTFLFVGFTFMAWLRGALGDS